jgi:hypothetical protein
MARAGSVNFYKGSKLPLSLTTYKRIRRGQLLGKGISGCGLPGMETSEKESRENRAGL